MYIYNIFIRRCVIYKKVISQYDAIKDIFDRWPISMAIIILQELSLYYHLDASTIIDLYQYIGARDYYLGTIAMVDG